MNISFSPSVIKKLLEKHEVSPEEVEECFYNQTKELLEDTREKHKTRPPTLWFVAETNEGRLLKVVFIMHLNGAFEVKTAYEPNNIEIAIYEKYA